MTTYNDPHNGNLKIDDTIHGYGIRRIAPIEAINATLYRLEHLVTGTRHLHISTDDQENTFGVTFKTVPTDSTGVAHILEHTVLCGSENYPVRDPFFSMLKRSLSTFMNAFTASDWTMYPFSTQNKKDYYNLMEVYLDAAFFPNLDELSFKQEGHRLEFEGDGSQAGNGRLIYKGVVYNEMKGAMSSPDQVMGRSMLNALYPDTTYGNNSGGDPAAIPHLTHAQLKAFHQRHYHPSNAYFYTYGNLPLKDHLAVIADKIMGRFERIDPQTEVIAQPRWSQPKTARYTYPLAVGEDLEHKSQVCLAWLTTDICDTFEVLVLSVLEQVLLGNAASPLRKALMDSGLGSALSDGTGYDADNRDTLFACGLKDVAEASAGDIEQIVLDVLGQLVKGGLDRELIQSAIHQIEFSRKEVTNTPYPYGIKLLLMTIGSWLHGGDPERVLQLDSDFERLNQEIAAGPFMENCIKTYFLDNPHRVRLSLVPDPQLSAVEEQRVGEELQSKRDQMPLAEQARIKEDMVRLKQLQESQEDIGCLPTLAIADIPGQVRTYTPTEVSSHRPLWGYHQSTSGIFYFNAASGAARVPEALLPWVPFFCFAFSKIGTRRHDYTEIARKIDAATGGLGMGAQARVLCEQPGTCLPLIAFNAKCLTRNIDPMFAIVEELLGEANFSDAERLKQLLGEYRAGLESMVVQNGHRLAISLSSQAFGPASALAEIWGGVRQLKTVREVTEQLDPSRLQKLADNLAVIGKAVVAPDNFIMATIGEPGAVGLSQGRIASSAVLSAFYGQSRPNLDLLDIKVDEQLPNEGWSTSTAVAFVAQTRATAPLGHPDAPALAVLSKLLRSLYLHREIREKGGAYGGFALYNAENGLFSLASYRDPHVVRTLGVYAGVADFIRTESIDDEDIKEATLQVCSEIDKPDPPGPAARKAFYRQMVGISDDIRLAYKKELLGLSKAQVLETAEKYFPTGDMDTGTAVIAGRDQLLEANKQLGDRALELHAI